ncbi:putative mycocerosate synthase [Rosa chinensis]|uniref:Putative mycocerosate synthase n=1 Tax=Rosa chinensis TaxID=74649 RepID=A0A2P6Q2R0_ROSCH|nr:putative mycocerosate synthase [Rosa chinensis]
MASGGIGTFAIQIARHQGVTVFVTAGDGAKLKACRDLGAELCINHNTEDFAELVMQKTEGIGLFSCIITPLITSRMSTVTFNVKS